VVSTPIRDVVRPYGELELVEIAEDPESFVAAAERAMTRYGEGAPGRAEWLRRVDDFIARGSWSRTFRQMSDLIEGAVAKRRGRSNGTTNGTL
jgi:UDP-galactopyranose mutase